MTLIRATVFGLDVRAEISLPILRGATALATGRPLRLTVAPGRRPALPAGAGFEPISDELHADGTVAYRIEAHPEKGYLLWGPHYGAQLLTPDGQQLTCSPGADDQGWQRLLIAQTLPFAAVLQGLEVLHASAVVLDGHAAAFVGPSGSGKTSLALALCRSGAAFLADDVLAVQPDGGVLLAHPGSPVAAVDHDEVLRSQPSPVTRQTLALNARERLLRTVTAPRPAPLGALFILDRRPNGPNEPVFEAITDTRALLGANFNFVLTAPCRLRRLLDVSALLARRPVQRILFGPAVDSSKLAAAVSRALGRPA